MDYEFKSSQVKEAHYKKAESYDSDENETVSRSSNEDKDKQLERSILFSDVHENSLSKDFEQAEVSLLTSEQSLKREFQNETDQEEKVLLERNGKFELVAVEDLSPEEREMFLINSSNKDANKSHANPKISSSGASGTNIKSGKRTNNSSLINYNKSASSAQVTSHGFKEEKQKIKPTSAQSNSQGNSTNQQHSSSLSSIKNNEWKRSDEDVEAKHKKERDTNEHFQAWLRKKKEQEEEKKENAKKENKEKEEESQREQALIAFDSWKAKKTQQLKKEKKMKEDEKKYYDSRWQTHSGNECEINFKRWLRAKQNEAKEKEEQERQKLKAYHLLVRRAKNSGNIVHGNAIHVGYYGYRF